MNFINKGDERDSYLNFIFIHWGTNLFESNWFLSGAYLCIVFEMNFFKTRKIEWFVKNWIMVFWNYFIGANFVDTKQQKMFYQ